MVRKELRLHPAALEEAEGARDWYAARSPSAAAAFLRELEIALAEVAASPNRWPSRPDGTRRFPFRRFPFHLIYRVHEDIVEVLATAHSKREPGYWKSR